MCVWGKEDLLISVWTPFHATDIILSQTTGIPVQQEQSSTCSSFCSTAALGTTAGII